MSQAQPAVTPPTNGASAASSKKNEALADRGSKALLGNYKPMPVVVTGGEGATITDVEGNKYIDLVGGIAVSSLGYGHPRLQAAIQEQTARVLHTSNIFWNEPEIVLAEKLVASSFADKVFFCNSGAEANEAMLKLARRYFHEKGEGRYEFICMDKSFHGRTMATVTCTGQEKYHQGFEPLLPGVRHVPFGDVRAIEAALTERTAAVLIEPIQGEGGIRMPPPGYLAAVRELCSKNGILLLLDEVQSCMGRTGTLWAYEQEGFTPDIMSLAKGIAGGLPLGAMLVSDHVGAALPYGSHGSTFGGNPVACAAGSVVMDEVTKPEFLANVTRLGHLLLERLQQMAKTHRKIAVEARGRGLWCGLELNVDATKVPRRALQKGVVMNVIGGKVLRFAPPLVITEQELMRGLDAADEIVAELARG